ncbi:thioredoxin [Wolbachia pipientis]|uniref:Thioredoxin n=1 Tax=Wolbachia pipientis TaxID=955 RepID=A0A1E7QJ92_WOLPI|nr:thioredoxin [Wolbachia pipientis]OEY86447.1 thioredoxin [Wolbachia pipientis]
MSRIVNDQNFDSEVINYVGFTLVDFWAEWCRPCKTLMPKIESLAKDREDKIKVCKFNVEDGTEIPSKYGIQSIPTLIMFKGGKEIARHTGFIEDLLSWVDDTISA